MPGVQCDWAETCRSLVGFGVPGAQNAEKNAHQTAAGVGLRFGARTGRICAETRWDGGCGVKTGVLGVFQAKVATRSKKMGGAGLKKIVKGAGANCARMVHLQRHRRPRNGRKRIFEECKNASCEGRVWGGLIQPVGTMKKIPFGIILKIPVEIRLESLPYQ